MLHAVTHAKPFQNLPDAAVTLCGRDPGTVYQRQCHIVGHIERRYQMKALKHKSDVAVTEFRHPGILHPGSGAAEQVHCPFGGIVKKSDQIEQRGLATSRRTHNAYKFPLLHRKVHVLKRHRLDLFCTVDFLHPFKFYHIHSYMLMI